MSRVTQIRNTTVPVALTLSFLMLAAGMQMHADGQSSFRERIRQRLTSRRQQSDYVQRGQLAGLNVAIWQPAKIPQQGAPLVIFSHGFHGFNSQSTFLMKALADAGYLVVSPNHKDAVGGGGAFAKPEVPLGNTGAWTEATHKDRAQDISKLINALHQDPQWNSKIDWSRLALAGHSLGGYTMLGLAGAWPSWKIPGVKAVLALSPYCQPFAKHQTLHNVNVPVMYQSGTTDVGVAPFISRPGGAFDQTPSPVIYVVFDRANHFAFSNLNRSTSQRDLINSYSVSFLNKYVLNDLSAQPEKKLPGVVRLQTK